MNSSKTNLVFFQLFSKTTKTFEKNDNLEQHLVILLSQTLYVIYTDVSPGLSE